MLTNQRRSKRWARRGRENRSNQRTRRIMNGTALPVVTEPSSRAAHRFGIQTVDRPTTNWAANSTVITSNTWVIPPVGAGRAGTNIKNRMVTAKAFSAKTSVRSPSVFGESPSSHASSWSLNGRSPCAPRPPRVRPGPRSRQRGRGQGLGAASTGVRGRPWPARAWEPAPGGRVRRPEPGERSVPGEPAERSAPGRPAESGAPVRTGDGCRRVGGRLTGRGVGPVAGAGTPAAAGASPAGGSQPPGRHPGRAAPAGPGSRRRPVAGLWPGGPGSDRGGPTDDRAGPDKCAGVVEPEGRIGRLVLAGVVRPPRHPRPRRGACAAPRTAPPPPPRSRTPGWPARPGPGGRPAPGTVR